METDLMPVAAAGRKPIFTPTDLAQYIRLDQCPRFLRLQLHTRNGRQLPPDNERVLRETKNLLLVETEIILQRYLNIGIADWQLRGDLDILRLHHSAEGVLHILITDTKRPTSGSADSTSFGEHDSNIANNS